MCNTPIRDVGDLKFWGVAINEGDCRTLRFPGILRFDDVCMVYLA